MNKRTKKLLAMMAAPPRLRRVSGLPPLIYTAKKADFLTDYRIYGQTVDGESVGDRTANLFDGEFLQGYWAYADGMRDSMPVTWITTSKLPCKPNTDYSFKSSYIGRYFGFVWFDSNGEYISSSYVSDTSSNMYVNFSSLSPVDAAYLIINIKSHYNTSTGDNFTITPSDVTDLMLNEGSTALPYEPYGYKVPMTVEGKNLFDYDTIMHGYRIQWSTGAYYADKTAIMSDFISVSENSTYATDTNLYWVCYDTNKQYIGAWNGSDIVKAGVDAINSMTAISPCKFIRILSFGSKVTPISSTTMLNCGSTALPYEPYHAPITTSIYLPEQIRKVGDEAEYIEYGTQKMYRIGADDLDVTLPVLPTVTGTNVLSVGTEVNPSEVEVTGRIRPVPTGGGE